MIGGGLFDTIHNGPACWESGSLSPVNEEMLSYPTNQSTANSSHQLHTMPAPWQQLAATAEQTSHGDLLTVVVVQHGS